MADTRRPVAVERSIEEQNGSNDHDTRAMKVRIYPSRWDLRERVFKDASETVQHIKKKKVADSQKAHGRSYSKG